jgi:hypothetical protein
MSSSYSVSESQSFTITNAIHMAAKVATDLKRMQRLYGSPSDGEIEAYEKESIALLKAGYFGVMTLGFKRNGQWIEPTLKYTSRDLAGSTANDDDPGRVRPGANVAGASFYSFLTYTSAWDALTADQRDTFKKSLPHYRGSGSEPSVNGYLVEDKTYSSGGRALTRASVRSA